MEAKSQNPPKYTKITNCTANAIFTELNFLINEFTINFILDFIDYLIINIPEFSNLLTD